MENWKVSQEIYNDVTKLRHFLGEVTLYGALDTLDTDRYELGHEMYPELTKKLFNSVNNIKNQQMFAKVWSKETFMDIEDKQKEYVLKAYKNNLDDVYVHLDDDGLIQWVDKKELATVFNEDTYGKYTSYLITPKELEDREYKSNNYDS